MSTTGTDVGQGNVEREGVTVDTLKEVWVRRAGSEIFLQTTFGKGKLKWKKLVSGMAINLRETTGSARYLRVWLNKERNVLMVLAGSDRWLSHIIAEWNVGEDSEDFVEGESFVSLASYIFDGKALPLASEYVEAGK